MTNEQALTLVIDYLAEQFEREQSGLSEKTNLFEDIGLDSIDALDMLGMLDKDYGVPVVEEEVETLVTIGDVVDYIVRHSF